MPYEFISKYDFCILEFQETYQSDDKIRSKVSLTKQTKVKFM